MIDYRLGDARELVHTIEGSIDCIITDPPYGVAFQSGFAKTESGKKLTREIANDDDLEGALALWYEVVNGLLPKMAEHCEIYVFTGTKVYAEWRDAVDLMWPGEVSYKNTLVWDKGWPGLGDLEANWANSFELILYAKRGNRPLKSRRSSVLTFDRMATSKHIHPTEKPVELLVELLEQSTSRGDLVVDPFGGSGSTMAACQRTGRRGISFEVDPEHYERAKSRLSQQTIPL